MGQGVASRQAPLLAVLVRRYVAWTERRVKSELRELARPDLQGWAAPPCACAAADILPLSACGNEWLLRRTYNDAAVGSPGFRPARVLDMIAFAAAPNHDPHGVFLARAGGRYVGTCVARYSAGVGRIYSMAVHPKFRRRGIGRALLHAALRHLQECGAVEARLYLHPDNGVAAELYTGEGFALAPARATS